VESKFEIFSNKQVSAPSPLPKKEESTSSPPKVVEVPSECWCHHGHSGCHCCSCGKEPVLVLCSTSCSRTQPARRRSLSKPYPASSGSPTTLSGSPLRQPRRPRLARRYNTISIVPSLLLLECIHLNTVM
jgi:hypothetical protein